MPEVSSPFTLDLVLALLLVDAVAAIHFAWMQHGRLYFPIVLTALATTILTAVSAVFHPDGLWFDLLLCYAIVLAGLLVAAWTRVLRERSRQFDPRRR